MKILIESIMTSGQTSFSTVSGTQRTKFKARYFSNFLILTVFTLEGYILSSSPLESDWDPLPLELLQLQEEYSEKHYVEAEYNPKDEWKKNRFM